MQRHMMPANGPAGGDRVASIFRLGSACVPLIVQLHGKVADSAHQNTRAHVIQPRLHYVQFSEHHVFRLLARILTDAHCTATQLTCTSACIHTVQTHHHYTAITHYYTLQRTFQKNAWSFTQNTPKHTPCCISYTIRGPFINKNNICISCFIF